MYLLSYLTSTYLGNQIIFDRDEDEINDELSDLMSEVSVYSRSSLN